MAWTKRKLVLEAYKEVGLASYIFDFEPEALQDGLIAMETMIAVWSGDGINFRYPMASDPDDADLDTEVDIPYPAIMAIYLNLAPSLAGRIGKAVSPDLSKRAEVALDKLSTFATKERRKQKQLPRWMPRGAGRKYWRGTNEPFVDNPDTDPISIGSDGRLKFRSK